MADAPRSTASAGNGSTAHNKAQQFEDEKKRIMLSCFSKQEADGSLIESYITHCRVIEDASSPSEPPNEDSAAENRKPRVILVAVRKSGRVRMHKARENATGTFSIGKTWNMDDLQAIITYGPPHERGFTVKILKNYYWQANSAKEKDFFLHSLLKIYRKYTAGKLPELEGFSRVQLDALLGPGGAELVDQQRKEIGRGPKTSTSSGNLTASTAFSSLPNSHSQRSLSSSQSIDSFHTAGPSRSQPSPRQNRPIREPPPDVSLLAGSGYLPSIASNSTKAPPADGLTGRGEPDVALPRHMTPPVGYPQGAPGPPDGRRPSDGSSTRTGQSRDPSRTRPARSDDERPPRLTPSQERLRTSSANSQQSQDSRREAMQHYPYQPPGPSPPQDARPSTKKSAKDVASQFRLAANTFNAGSTLASPKYRPKTPTTPGGSTSGLPPRTPTEAVPAVMPPPNNFSGDRKSSRDEANGKGYDYGRRPSRDNEHPKAPDAPPVPLMPPNPRSVTPKEPPPRNDARGRPPPLARENIEPQMPVQSPPGTSKVPLSISEPPLIMQRQGTGVVNSTPRRPGRDDTVAAPGRPSSRGNENGLAASTSRDTRSRSRSAGTKARMRRSTKVTGYLENLDRSGLSVDIEELLAEFKWDSQTKLEHLEADVKKELSRVESSNLVINQDGGNDKIDQLSGMLNDAIKECENMDALLTLYAVELTSLTDDIAHIEAQSQGLQLQTANQKTLQKELTTLLETISISPSQIDVLRQASLESTRDLEKVEHTLVALYKAMRTIEPSSTPDSSSSTSERRSSLGDENVGSMRALQERKGEYRSSCHAFLGRLHQFLNIKFHSELMEMKNAASGTATNSTAQLPVLVGHERAYRNLWKFAGLIAFAREADGDEFIELRRLYERPVKQFLQDEVQDHITAWKKITRKPTQEETDLTFNAPEKGELVSISTARKLTVKKSIARIRSGSLVGNGVDRPQAGLINSHQAFAGAFGEIYQLVFREQNFVVDLFHMSSRSTFEFVDFVLSAPPEARYLSDLGTLRAVEQDKLRAKLIYDFMTDLFSFLIQDFQNMVDWATTNDAMQGVGIMHAIEQKLSSLAETDQEFLLKTLQMLHDRLAGLFSRFLDDQIKAIEETKVKIKKRKGVIGFMRVFPAFAARIEEQLPYDNITSTSHSTSYQELEVREMVNDGYGKINKAMFESLQAIAKESPNVTSQNVDPEDKEQLNYHIMMIENMHHYIEEVDTRGNQILDGFMRTAEEEYKEHMGLYINAVIRRPLSKLLDFIETVEQHIRTNPAEATELPNRSSTSKAVFKKQLEHNDGKDIRKGIEALKKRVDKHFADGDDAVLSYRLVDTILNRLEGEYVSLHKRIMLLLVGPYKECGLECGFLVSDVRAGFKK